jgi:hypothetical protein
MGDLGRFIYPIFSHSFGDFFRVKSKEQFQEMSSAKGIADTANR